MPWFQQLCGARLTPKVKADEALDSPNAQRRPDYAETWQDPEAPILLRLLNGILSFFFHFGAFLGYEPFYVR